MIAVYWPGTGVLIRNEQWLDLIFLSVPDAANDE